MLSSKHYRLIGPLYPLSWPFPYHQPSCLLSSLQNLKNKTLLLHGCLRIVAMLTMLHHVCLVLASFPHCGGCCLVCNSKSKAIRVDFEVKLYNGQHKYAFKVKMKQESPFKHIIASAVRKWSEKKSKSKGCVNESSSRDADVLFNIIVSVVCNMSDLTDERDDIDTTLDDLDSHHNPLREDLTLC